MDIRKMDFSELELLSFTDIAYKIIKQDKEPKTTVVLFKEICHLLKMSDKEYEDLVGDFFTSLTTDKHFILLNSVNWDLRENHVINIVIDDSEEDFEEVEEIDSEDEEEIAVEDSPDLDNDGIDDLIDSEDADDDEEMDELGDLEIVDEDAELEE